MFLEILSGSFFGFFVGYLVSKKISISNFDTNLKIANAKAKAIESESDKLLKKSKNQAKNTEKKAELYYKDSKNRAIEDLSQREEDINLKENQFLHYKNKEIDKIKEENKKIKIHEINLNRQEELLLNLKEKYNKKTDELFEHIESSAGITSKEAKVLLLKKQEEKSRKEIANIVRKYEKEAEQEAEKKANYILSKITSSYAGKFSSQRLTSIVKIENEDIKGRIIGKEGRNIKTMESIMGVDIIIDDTPDSIVVSCFNLYRRAIATKSLETLIKDGRIQPAKIEDVFASITEEFESEILREGEEVIASMNIAPMHQELVKLVGKLRYRASYGQNALEHTIEVANLAGMMASELNADVSLAKRAGLLHDIGKALTNEHKGSHVDLGAEICNRYNEHEIVINTIYAHHGF